MYEEVAPTGTCTASCTVNNVVYGVRNASGGSVKGNTLLTADTPGTDQMHDDPNLARLAGDKALLSWECHSTAATRDICYSVLNSTGTIFKSMTNLSQTDGSSYDVDAVQLPNNTTVLAWREYYNGSQVAFATLDGSYNRSNLPAVLNNPENTSGDLSPSVTYDTHNRAIITWGDFGYSRIYYALVDGSGAIITPAITLLTSIFDYMETSYTGMGNTVFNPISSYLPVVLRPSYYFEGPYEAEPNNSIALANGYLRSAQNYYG